MNWYSDWFVACTWFGSELLLEVKFSESWGLLMVGTKVAYPFVFLYIQLGILVVVQFTSYSLVSLSLLHSLHSTFYVPLFWLIDLFLVFGTLGFNSLFPKSGGVELSAFEMIRKWSNWPLSCWIMWTSASPTTQNQSPITHFSSASFTN